MDVRSLIDLEDEVNKLQPNKESSSEPEEKHHMVDKINYDIVNHCNITSLTKLTLSKKAMDIIDKKLPASIKELFEKLKDYDSFVTFLAYDTVYDLIATNNIPKIWKIIGFNNNTFLNIIALYQHFLTLGLTEITDFSSEDDHSLNGSPLNRVYKFKTKNDDYIELFVADLSDAFLFNTIQCPYFKLEDIMNYDFPYEHFHNVSEQNNAVDMKVYSLNDLDFVGNPYHRAEAYSALLNTINFVPYQLLFDYNYKTLITSKKFYKSYFGYNPSGYNIFREIQDSRFQLHLNIFDNNNNSFLENRFKNCVKLYKYDAIDAAMLLLKNIILYDFKESHENLIFYNMPYKKLYTIVYYTNQKFEKKELIIKKDFFDGNILYIKENQSPFYTYSDYFADSDDLNLLFNEFRQLTFSEKYKRFTDLIYFANDWERFYSYDVPEFTAVYGENTISRILLEVFPELSKLYNFVLKTSSFSQLRESYAQSIISKINRVDIFYNLAHMISNYIYLRGVNPLTKDFLDQSPEYMEYLILLTIYIGRGIVVTYDHLNDINKTFYLNSIEINNDSIVKSIDTGKQLFIIENQEKLHLNESKVKVIITLFDIFKNVFTNYSQWNFIHLNESRYPDYHVANNLFGIKLENFNELVWNYDLFQNLDFIYCNNEMLINIINYLYFILFSVDIVYLPKDSPDRKQSIETAMVKAQEFMKYYQILNIDDEKLGKYLASKQNILKYNYYLSSNNLEYTNILEIKKYLAYLVSEAAVPNDEDALMEEVYKII